MDWQRFEKISSARMARCSREKFTGKLLAKVCYRNGQPKRATVETIVCRIFRRETFPMELSPSSPAEIIRNVAKHYPADGVPNEDSEFSVVFEFFAGVVVDMRTGVVQHI